MTPDELKSWREERRMTQWALAAMLDVDQASVSRWEAGKVRIPHWVGRILQVERTEEASR